MCGIAGVVHTDPRRGVDAGTLSAMNARLAHRGPDDDGIWIGEGAGLAHRRLAVIDLSPAGRQPMSNEDGSVFLVFNGEIYNHHELREELEGRGHRFRSRTDSEVIVHLYEEAGGSLVHRLHGMFAFAIWDAKRRRLLLARDRLGKKPVKYVEIDGGLAFASELKALLGAGLASRTVDPLAIDQFLSVGYVPSPRTGFRDIRKLPPGHVLTWENGGLRTERYWSPDFGTKRSRTGPGWHREIRDTVRRAVRRRLESDVPLGVLLSGGIDSSIVTACVAMESDRPVDTFSIGFDDSRRDETPRARAVASRYRTRHHEIVVGPGDTDLLPSLAALYEEPFADTSVLPTCLVARAARRDVTVVLTGDGGDEGFAGYTRYARMLSWAGRAPVMRASGLRALCGLARRALATSSPAWLRPFDGLYHLAAPDLATGYFWWARLFSDLEAAALRARNPRTDAGGGAELLRPYCDDPRAGTDPLDRILHTDLLTYLPDDLLVKVDLASMAHGLEARAPLLDHELIELAASVPARFKAPGGRLKGLLRDAFRDDLPPEVLDAPKVGFGSPVQEWFAGSLMPMARDVLTGPGARIRDHLCPKAVTQLLRAHERGILSRGGQLWALTMLEFWLREVVERGPAADC